MGLSSKQVSGSGLDNWNKALLQPPPAMRKQQQQQQQQNQPSEPLKCPRCESTNTKFCYYNNYNKSQPRHFCRTCKRHWTKGGTLRNVPVGGGRKNKRMKKSASSTSSSAIATPTPATTVTTPIANLDGGVHIHVANIQSPHQQIKKNLPLAVNDQKDAPSCFQSMIRPPSLMSQQNLVNTREMETKDFGTGNGLFLGSSFALAQNQGLLFPFSSSSSFETNPSSVSASLRSSSNVYNYVEEFKPLMEEPPMNTLNSALLPSTSGSNTQPWEMPPPAAATSGATEMSSFWNWDIDSLVSTDPSLSWDDSDIKP